MQSANGRLSLARARATIEPVGPLTIGRFGFLMLLGVLTYALHKAFHYPLKMPGHLGLEAMALLVIGRLSCTSPWSATLVCLSALTAAGFATGTGHDASAALIGLAPGLLIDAAVLMFKNWRAHIFLLPVLASIGHATKPLIRFGLNKAFGIPFGSLGNGVTYPFVSHLAYGFAGGLVAVLVWRATVSRWRQN